MQYVGRGKWKRPRQTIRWAAIVLNLVFGLLMATLEMAAYLRHEPSEPVEALWIVASIVSLLAVVALLSERRLPRN
jgi:hypothetical protein